LEGEGSGGREAELGSRDCVFVGRI
jgi:hypothetical protein